MKLVILSLFNIICAAYAFAPSSTIMAPKSASPSTLFSAAEADADDAPRMNPDKPELPEIKGDFDWDAKFAADEDWIVDNVPGKMTVSDVELAAQSTALGKIEEKYRKVRLQE
eukprot:587091_1